MPSKISPKASFERHGRGGQSGLTTPSALSKVASQLFLDAQPPLLSQEGNAFCSQFNQRFVRWPSAICYGGAIGIVAYLLLTLTTAVAQQSAVDGIVVKLGTGEALADAQVNYKQDRRTQLHGNDRRGWKVRVSEPRTRRIPTDRDARRRIHAHGIWSTQSEWRRDSVTLTVDEDRRAFNWQWRHPARSPGAFSIGMAHQQFSFLSRRCGRRTRKPSSGQVSVVEAALTNDLGEFRLFWLPGTLLP